MSKPSGAEATAGAGEADAALKGCVYASGRSFAQQYCAPCHSKAGTESMHERAYNVLQIDTYEQWKAGHTIILAVVDRWHLDGHLMPPPGAIEQPTDEERMALLDWVRRGSPNTKSGD